METFFRNLSKNILDNLKHNEELMINFWGENSHFTRFNQSKVRQNGFVSDLTLSITLICSNRTCSASFSLSNNDKQDLEKALSYLNSLRHDIVKLPKDPFIVYPKDGKPSSQNNKGTLLNISDVDHTLSPTIKNVDLSGIWASGNLFVGYANSKGLTHWFSTESFSFDYSLITKEERMVKDTFAGTDFNLNNYKKVCVTEHF